MRPSSFGQGRALCMLQLPGITNHSCFWPLPCFPTVPPSRLKVRLDPHMTSNVFRWLALGQYSPSYVSGVELATSQSVLIALAADLHTNKPWQGQHKFWKYVSPIRTYFAWLPERLARTYCSAALDKCPDLPYGEVHHLQGSDADEKHSMVFQNIYHIGDTKSAQELEVFLRMSRERLRLCCGLQCTDRLHPNGPRQRRVRSSFMQRSSCYGSPLESRLFGVKTMHRLLYMRPSGRSSALKTDMYLLR